SAVRADRAAKNFAGGRVAASACRLPKRRAREEPNADLWQREVRQRSACGRSAARRPRCACCTREKCRPSQCCVMTADRHSLIVRTTLEVGRLLTVPPPNSLMIASSYSGNVFTGSFDLASTIL